MILTSNYALKKPEGTDPVDLDDFNDNAEAIDTELKNLADEIGTTDISELGDGTITGAIASQNEALANLNTDLEYKTYAAATGDAAYFTVDIICIKQGNTIFINGTIKVLSNVNGNAVPVILPYGFIDQSARWHNIQMTNISTWEKYDAAYIVDRHIVTRGDVSTLEAGTYIVDQVLCDYSAVNNSAS